MTVAFPYVGSRFADPHRGVRRCAVRGHRHLCRGEEEGPAVNFGIGTVVRARGRCARRSGRYCFRGLWDRSSAPMSCGHPQVFFRAAGTRYQHIPNTRLLPLLGSVPPSASQTEGGGRTGFPFRRYPYGVLQEPCREGSVMLRRFQDPAAVYVHMPSSVSCGILPFGVFGQRMMS